MSDWVVPKYTRAAVRRAGEELAAGTATSVDIDIVNNWRASHAFPLNTLQVSLRNKSIGFDENAVIAQRIKRLPSIELKLRLQQNMDLARMQDLGGCRAVVANVGDVSGVWDAFKKTQHKHTLRSHKDYISEPRDSGYRGVHLIYQYHSDRNPVYNGHLIEVQIRSRVQHTWATAVETVGTFTGQALKSSLGNERWLRFFQLMGSAYALREACTTVPGTPSTKKELVMELRELAVELDAITQLSHFASTTETLVGNSQGNYFYLLTLDRSKAATYVQGFPKNQLEFANIQYDAREREFADNEAIDVVLVSVDSLKTLTRAYPNYFLDISAFRKDVAAIAASPA